MIKKINFLLEKVDPYFTQRLIFYKSLYIATILTYVNWTCHLPLEFTAFMNPAAMIAPVYENATLTSYKDKKNIFVLLFTLAAIYSVIFYLVFPYKFTFMFTFIAGFAILYFGGEKFFPKAKPFAVLVIVVACMNMSNKPSLSLQVAIDMFAVIMLTMLVCYFSIITFPNHYFKVWKRAYGLYVNSIRNILIADLNYMNNNNFISGTNHMNTMRAYRRLLKKDMFIKATRAGFSMGNVFVSLSCMKVTSENREFWVSANEHLNMLYHAVRDNQQLPLFTVDVTTNNKTEIYFKREFNISINNWNKLCAMI